MRKLFTSIPRRLRVIMASAACLLLIVFVGAAWAILHLRPSVDVSSSSRIYNPASARNPGLSATFFGATTILLTDGTTSLMTDGFFSRPSFLSLATSISPAPAEIAFALQKTPRRIAAIFVAHSHHDHAMDCGLVAQRTGAMVYGSESTLNVARGVGAQDGQLRALRAGETVSVGQFQVTAFETPHSPHPASPGFVDAPVRPPAKLGDYRLAENFSFFVEHPLGKVLIVPSANYRPGAFDGLRADIVVLGIGTLGKQSLEFTQNYWNEAVQKTGAKLVLPVHWDDFTRSLRVPLVPLPFFMDDMGVAVERLGDLARRDGVNIRFLPLMQEVVLPAPER